MAEHPSVLTGAHALLIPSEESEESPKQILPDLVRRYASGESLKDLAKEFEVSRQTIYNWIFSDMAAPEHQEIVTQCLINRICEADEELDESADKVDVMRARAKAEFVRRDFERRRPKLYAPKQQIDVDRKVTVIVQRQKEPKLLNTQDIEVAAQSQE